MYENAFILGKPLRDKEWLRQKYETEKMTGRQIAGLLNVDHTAVHYWLKKHGIKPRSSRMGIGGWKKTGAEKQKISELHKGPKNPQWKGGKFLDHGYVRINKPDHPQADKKGYVLEHRLMVERPLGRYLKNSEKIHHINENKTDNQTSNLLICSNSYHVKLHRQIQKRRRECRSKI